VGWPTASGLCTSDLEKIIKCDGTVPCNSEYFLMYTCFGGEFRITGLASRNLVAIYGMGTTLLG